MSGPIVPQSPSASRRIGICSVSRQMLLQLLQLPTFTELDNLWSDQHDLNGPFLLRLCHASFPPVAFGERIPFIEPWYIGQDDQAEILAFLGRHPDAPESLKRLAAQAASKFIGFKLPGQDEPTMPEEEKPQAGEQP